MLSVWAACSVTAWTLVIRYGRSSPFSDDWQLLPYAAGRRTVTGSWLWQQHNEHRIPLVKALNVVLLRAFDFDYRATTMANALVLSALALTLVLAVRHYRGTSRLRDAAIPLVMLNPHVPALQWGVQAQFTATAAALVLILVIAARQGKLRVLNGRALALWSLALGLLFFSGMNGVVVLPVVAGALLISAWRSAGSRAVRVSAGVAGALGLAAVPLYFVGLQSTGHAWGHPGPAQLITVAVRLAGSPLGPVVEQKWPVIGVVIIVLAVLTLVEAWRRRTRALGLLLVVAGAQVLLAAAVAFGRGGQQWNPYLSNHYSTLFLPMVGLLVLASAPELGRAVRPVLAAAGVCLLLVSFGAARDAVHVGERQRAAQRAFDADVRAGVTLDELVARHVNLLYYEDSDATRRIVAQELPTLLCAGRQGPCPN